MGFITLFLGPGARVSNLVILPLLEIKHVKLSPYTIDFSSLNEYNHKCLIQCNTYVFLSCPIKLVTVMCQIKFTPVFNIFTGFTNF